MNFTKSLLDLYEANKEIAGIEKYSGKKKTVLLPLYHDSLRVGYEAVLTADGDLVEIRTVPDEDKDTLLPVYQPSRSRETAPMALCDKIDYLCDKGEHHDRYMEKLKKWRDSKFSHPALYAVYAYLEKGTLRNDLAAAIGPKKVVKKDMFVRFTVLLNKEELHTWTDLTLQESFIEYMRSMGGSVDIDYLTGEEMVIANKFPKRIRHASDNTTLISSNKDSFYDLVFTGNFDQKEKIASVGSESSYKMINALKWAVRSKGRLYGSVAIAVWCNPDIPAPKWDVDTYEMEQAMEGKPDDDTESEGEMEDLEEIVPENETEEPEETVFSEQQVIHMLDGYRKSMPIGSVMTLLAVDTPSKENNGRCAIINHVELDGRNYLENIERWHKEAGWVHRKRLYSPENKVISFTGVPGMRDIANIVYGIEVDRKGQRVIGFVRESDRDLFYKKTVTKLMPCIWRNSPIPVDIVKKVAEKASYPLHYKNSYNWERVVKLTCSFYKKYLFDKEGKVFDMALDTTCTDRNYLFGRLLAVADFTEKVTYNPVADRKRVTNAQRSLTKFMLKPATIWTDLRKRLIPYLRKISFYRRERIINPLLNEITDTFNIEDFNDTKLSPLFFLGYDSQMMDLRQKWYKAKEEEEKEQAQES